MEREKPQRRQKSDGRIEYRHRAKGAAPSGEELRPKHKHQKKGARTKQAEQEDGQATVREPVDEFQGEKPAPKQQDSSKDDPHDSIHQGVGWKGGGFVFDHGGARRSIR